MRYFIALLLTILFCPASFARAVTVTVGQPTTASVANGELGNKSGAVNDNISPTTYPGNDQGLTSCMAATASGTVRYIHVYLGSSSGTTGQQYNAALSDSSGNKIADGALASEGTVPGTTTITLDSDQTITSGTTYCLSFGAHNSPDSWNIGATTTSGVNVYYDSTYTVGATMPDTVDVSTVKSNNLRLRIWATNTANGS